MSMYEVIGANNPEYLLADPNGADLIAIPGQWQDQSRHCDVSRPGRHVAARYGYRGRGYQFPCRAG